MSGRRGVTRDGRPVTGGALVARYLRTGNVTAVGPVRTENGTIYRVRARGVPRDPPVRTVRNYTAGAAVTEGGIVRRLTVGYGTGRNGSVGVTLIVEHGLLRTPEPPPPRWYRLRWGEEP